MHEVGSLTFKAPSGMLARRFVTIIVATDTVAYTAVAAQPDAITLGDEDNLVISVALLTDTSRSFQFDAAGIIALGESVEVVGVVGKGTVQTAGAVACLCKLAAVNGSISVGYNKVKIIVAPTNAGVVGAGVTAVEAGDAFTHVTTLTVSKAMPAIAGAANQGVGIPVYTLPAGAKVIKTANFNLGRTQAGALIGADTPELGLGTTIGTGAQATLGAVGAGCENILHGASTIALGNCTGTKSLDGAVVDLYIAAAGDHVIYANIADGWAGADAGPTLAGTIVIEWVSL